MVSLLAFLFSCPWGRLTSNSHPPPRKQGQVYLDALVRCRARSPKLHLLRDMASQFSHSPRSRDPRASSSACHGWQGMGVWGRSAPCNATTQQMPSADALLCCPGKVQDLLASVLQQVKGQTSSPAFLTHPPLLLTTSGEGKR